MRSLGSCGSGLTLLALFTLRALGSCGSGLTLLALLTLRSLRSYGSGLTLLALFTLRSLGSCGSGLTLLALFALRSLGSCGSVYYGEFLIRAVGVINSVSIYQTVSAYKVDLDNSIALVGHKCKIELILFSVKIIFITFT